MAIRLARKDQLARKDWYAELANGVALFCKARGMMAAFDYLLLQPMSP